MSKKQMLGSFTGLKKNDPAHVLTLPLNYDKIYCQILVTKSTLEKAISKGNNAWLTLDPDYWVEVSEEVFDWIDENTLKIDYFFLNGIEDNYIFNIAYSIKESELLLEYTKKDLLNYIEEYKTAVLNESKALERLTNYINQLGIK